jgi:hypothetical protein
MTKNMIQVHDAETNEIVTREMTGEEQAQYDLDQVDIQAEAEALTAIIAEKAEAKTALLKRLGITEEEAELLLG